MTRPPTPARLANFLRMRRRQTQQCAQRFKTQMRLIAQNNNPMRQRWIPIAPGCGALNGTEHAAFRFQVSDAVARRKTEPVEFPACRLIPDCMHHGDLSRACGLPLRDEMSKYGSLTPWQKQYGFAHPRRRPR